MALLPCCLTPFPASSRVSACGFLGLPGPVSPVRGHPAACWWLGAVGRCFVAGVAGCCVRSAAVGAWCWLADWHSYAHTCAPLFGWLAGCVALLWGPGAGWQLVTVMHTRARISSEGCVFVVLSSSQVYRRPCWPRPSARTSTLQWSAAGTCCCRHRQQVAAESCGHVKKAVSQTQTHTALLYLQSEEDLWAYPIGCWVCVYGRRFQLLLLSSFLPGR